MPKRTPSKDERAAADRFQAACIRQTKATRAEQGLPEKVEDPVAIERVAAILRTSTAKKKKAATSALSPEEERAADRLLETTRQLQGLPEHIEDPAVIDRIGKLFRGEPLWAVSDAELRRELARRDAARLDLLPPRPPRRMPSLKKVRIHHKLGPRPYCVRCGTVTRPEDLVRAHIIDRVFGGLDNAANLAPLCEWCHEIQPIFQPGQENEALDWFGLPPLDAPRLTASVIAPLAEALLVEPVPVSEETFAWFWDTPGITIETMPYHPMVAAIEMFRRNPEWMLPG